MTLNVFLPLSATGLPDREPNSPWDPVCRRSLETGIVVYGSVRRVKIRRILTEGIPTFISGDGND